jgi:hypothetical protein
VTLTVEGLKYKLDPAKLPAIMARIRGTEVNKFLDAMLFVRGCTACACVCVDQAHECKCCLAYGTRNPGGGIIYYPEREPAHCTLMAASVFAAHELFATARAGRATSSKSTASCAASRSRYRAKRARRGCCTTS